MIGAKIIAAKHVLRSESGEIIRTAEADVFLLREGEDPEAVTAHVHGQRSFADTVVGTPEQIRAHVQALSDTGIDYVIVYMDGVGG